MFLKTAIVSFFMFAVSFSIAVADQKITCEIVSEVNGKNPEDRREIERITSAPDVMKIKGWVKVESNSTNVEPARYLLEWRFKDGDKEIILDSYTRNEFYRFDVKLDRTITYYWVNKRIFLDKAGTYIFFVFKKTDNENQLIGKKELVVEKSS